MFFRDFIHKKSVDVDIFIQHLTAFKGNSSAELFFLLTMRGPKGVDITRFSKFLWTSFVDHVQEFDGNTIDALKVGVFAVQEHVRQILSKDDVFVEKGLDVNFVACLVIEDELYAVSFGECNIWLLQNDNIINISNLLRENKSFVGSLLIDESSVVALTTPNLDLKKARVTQKNELLRFLKSVQKEENSVGAFVFSKSELLDNVEASEKVKTSQVKPSKLHKTDSVRNSSMKKSSDNSKKDFKFLVEKSLIVIRQVVRKLKTVTLKFINVLAKTFSYLGAYIKSIADKYLGRKLWYKRLLSKISLIKTSSVSPQSIKIGGFREKQQKKRKFAILLMFIIVLFGVVFAYKALFNIRARTKAHGDFVNISTELSKELDEIKPLLTSDRKQAEARIVSVKKEISDIRGNDVIVKYLSPQDKEKLDQLETQLQSEEDILYKRTIVNKDNGLKLVVDAKIALGDNSDVQDIVVRQDTYMNQVIFITDQGLKKVYKISDSDFVPHPLSDPKELIVSPKFVDWGNDGLYVYDMVNGVVVSKFGDKDKSLDFTKVSGVDVDSFDLASPTDFAILGNDSPNLLDAASGSVVRSVRYSSGSYGIPSKYITDDSIKNGVDIFADLYIYVVTSDGQIIRFSKNSQHQMVGSSISISEFPGEAGEWVAACSGLDQNSDIYVFDKRFKRILVFEKPLESGENLRHPGTLLFKKQFVLNLPEGVLDAVRDIAIDKLENNLYILDVTGVWQLSLSD